MGLFGIIGVSSGYSSEIDSPLKIEPNALSSFVMGPCASF